MFNFMPIDLKVRPKRPKPVMKFVEKSKPKSLTPRTAKTPRTHKPTGMSLEDWQVALRREFGRDQSFELTPVDARSTLGEFVCRNPDTQRAYRLSIRGGGLGENFCSCPDFRINTLGTCKHLEFALKVLMEEWTHRRAIEAGVRPAYSEIFLRFGAEREVVVRFGSDCPASSVRAVNDMLGASSLGANEVLRADSLGHLEWVIDRLRKDGHDVRVDDQAVAWVAQLRDAERLRRRVDQLFPRGINSPAFDSLLKTELYPYQRQGVLFLAKAGRALLADDMGLGKTLQSLAAAEVLARVGGVERVLVVTLTSLKHQWKSEIEKFTSRGATVIQGAHAKRAGQWGESDQDKGFYKVTSYQLLAADAGAIRQWSPDLIILDEAQRIKNWKTRTAQVTKELQSQYAMVLTGTPLENRLEELHSIVQFVDRYRLGPLFRFLDRHQLTDDKGKVTGYTRLGEVAQTLSPVLMRRTKSEVLKQLPERIDNRYFVQMTPDQKAIHDDYNETVARLVHKWRANRYLSESDQKRLQAALQSMRMVCNSTFLIDPTTDSGNKIGEIVSRLDEILEDPTNKVVVFSQWVGSHQLIAKKLDAMGVGFEFLHGGVPGEKRGPMIERFRNDAKTRVFLSTDAGGIGLNLQAASVVIVVDQPWNPALLEQRIGRVHRMGQSKRVQVLHFITQGSIEEGILSLQKFKRGLAAGVLDGGADSVHFEGNRLQSFMKGVENATQLVGNLTPETAQTTSDIEPTAIQPPGTSESSVPRIETASPAFSADALVRLATAGRALFDQLLGAVQPAGSSANPSPVRIDRDPDGRPVLKLSLADDQALSQTLGRFGELLSALSDVVAASKPQAK